MKQKELLKLDIQFFAGGGMSKQERALRQALAEKRTEIEALTDEGKLDEAKKLLAEAQQIKDQIQTYEDLRNMQVSYAQEEPQQDPEAKNPQQPTDDIAKTDAKNHVQLFASALRTGKVPQPLAAMKEGVDEDGGLIVPQDISTKINEKRRQFDTLANLVDVIPVSTNKGSRVLEKLADITPLVNLEELADIEELENPKFENIKYSIKDYAGILVLSNDLLADTQEALLQYLSNWLAKKSAVTRNTLILNQLGTLAKTTVSKQDDIKDILNVKLDPAINATTKVVTNQSGFNVLDKLKDAFGRYLLQPNPTDPTKKLLFGKPVSVISDKYLPNGGTKTTPKYPLIIGDLKEAVKLFDRQQYSILTTNVGGKAFYRNSTDMRIIEREDVVLWDTDAVVYAEFASIKDAVPDNETPSTGDTEDKSVDVGK
ncbi:MULTISPECIES: phage major capsid protein [Bacillus]|uniref:phage major capsid protein n=1 Tax=Bacillus TaxID=1386 RepID=UPI001CCEC386|nr:MULTISPECIES: phage major capsid protein [Bacillus]MEC0340070.1 phage major capsid protein [Bacillus sonorensis]MEC0425747.1 phage major capsid protein [Bacillus sonorensis]MEC0458606.1 phage major capsid protein [Bacillus sonorensis]MEC0528183.1 phage major capsid protein [Bacillus sonorensis]UBF33904.1 phage major capsid protein [Bacillus sp. PM8313]